MKHRKWIDLKKHSSMTPYYRTIKSDSLFFPQRHRAYTVKRFNRIYHYKLHTHGDWSKELRVEKYKWHFNLSRIRRRAARRRSWNERYYPGKYETMVDAKFYGYFKQKCFTELPPARSHLQEDDE